MTFERFSQWWIGLFGSVGFFLISTRHPIGFVFVLLTEPFWFISTYRARQWGMFFLTTLYTISCGIGIYNWF